MQTCRTKAFAVSVRLIVQNKHLSAEKKIQLIQEELDSLTDWRAGNGNQEKHKGNQ